MGAVARAAVTRRLEGCCVTPAVSFDMSVGKRKHARAEMLHGGAMPEPAGVSHEQNEAGITQVERGSVNERVELACIVWRKFRSFEEGVSGGTGFFIVQGKLPPEIGIERVTAGFLVNRSEHIRIAAITWAFINFRFVEIGGEERLPRIEQAIYVGEELRMDMLAALDP